MIDLTTTSLSGQIFINPVMSLTIGPVLIDSKTGNITIRESVSMDEASRAFWSGLQKAFAQLRFEETARAEDAEEQVAYLKSALRRIQIVLDAEDLT